MSDVFITIVVVISALVQGINIQTYFSAFDVLS